MALRPQRSRFSLRASRTAAAPATPDRQLGLGQPLARRLTFSRLFRLGRHRRPGLLPERPPAITFQQQYNWDAVRAACHELASSARRDITALVGGTPICPDSPHWFGQMCAIPLPIEDAPTVQWRLREEWSIEIPIF